MCLPDTLTFSALFIAQMGLFSCAFLVLAVVGCFPGQFHLIEFRLAGMVFCGNVLMIAASAWHYETSAGRILLWATGSLLCAAGIWALALLLFNAAMNWLKGRH
jgi:hypothetical protein